MDIRWDNPNALYGLWLLVPLALLLAWAHKRRRKAAGRFVEPSMGERIMPLMKGSTPWTRGACVLLGFACIALAAARPRWGAYFETAVRHGADVMILLDVSRSMLSQDVAPSRLERSKSDILDLLHRLQGDRVGLIAFAGKAVVACPLTTDQGFFRMVLDRTGPESVPRGGTAIGDAIREALKNMESRGDRDQAILLITDGEDHDSFPAEAAAMAAERGVKVFTVGLGDPAEGSRIPVVDASGNRTYLKHGGQEVWSRMDERLLQEIALKTQGAYVPAKTAAYDLGEVYENHLAALARSEIESEKRKRYRDRFQLFVGAALVSFLLERLLQPFRARSMGLATVAILFTALSVAAGPEDKIKEGIARFKEGKLEEAWKLFSDVDVSMPENRRMAFNRGVVRHAQGDADAARTLYEKAMSARDPELTALTHYNLGTLEAERARVLFGEKPEESAPEKRQEGIGLLQQAIRQYRSCLELEPDHKDARHNVELIRLWLKHMADVWSQKDREKQREELDLFSFVEMLLDQQKRLQDGAIPLREQADSPRRREAIRQLAADQRKLAEEIDPLKKKIAESLKAPQTQGADEEQRKRFQETLEGWADEVGKAMSKAADDVGGALWDEARGFQTKAIDELYRIWSALAPFERVLQRSIRLEEGVVEGTTPLENEKESPDLFSLLRDQERVKALAGMLPAKAEQGKKHLDVTPAPLPEGHKESEKQKQNLKQAFDKAIELAPKIEHVAGEAAKDLGEKKPREALPKEKEALELLKEIAKSLPQNQQPQSDPNKQNEQKEKPGQDQAKQPRERRQQLAQEQAEALMQKARERERDYQERKRELLRGAAGRVNVDRDW